MVGRTFGRLFVLSEAIRSASGQRYWRCECQCGVVKTFIGQSLRAGLANSCGCLRSELTSLRAKQRRSSLEPAPVVGAKWIPLTREQFSLVDEADFETVSSFNWMVHGGYAARAEGPRNGYVIRLHRFLLGAPDGQSVDHINHDTLDNRRANLRLASASDQMANRLIGKNNTSGFKGVFLDARKMRWIARIGRGRTFLGLFDSPEEAAEAYDTAARNRFGEFACTNHQMRTVPK